MPGFQIEGIGGNSRFADSNASYYTKFYWEIQQLLGLAFAPGSVLVSLKSCSLPTFKVDVETIVGASHKYKHAKSIDWENIKVTWYDTVGLLPIMKQWRESVWSFSGGLKTPDTYKKNSSILVKTPDEVGSQKWNLYQSWPASITHGDLSYTESEVKLIDVDIVYDWAEESSEVTET
jgi:hypothetical protein